MSTPRRALNLDAISAPDDVARHFDAASSDQGPTPSSVNPEALVTHGDSAVDKRVPDERPHHETNDRKAEQAKMTGRSDKPSKPKASAVGEKTDSGKSKSVRPLKRRKSSLPPQRPSSDSDEAYPSHASEEVLDKILDPTRETMDNVMLYVDVSTREALRYIARNCAGGLPMSQLANRIIVHWIAANKAQLTDRAEVNPLMDL